MTGTNSRSMSHSSSSSQQRSSGRSRLRFPWSRRAADGFTILEVLCVTAVIALLAALVVIGMSPARSKVDRMKAGFERQERSLQKVQNPD